MSIKERYSDISLGKESNELITRAFDCLNIKDFSAAGILFEEVLKNEPECVEAHEGLLMARSETNNIEELTEYYKKLLVDDKTKPEIIEAIEEDTDHIDETVEKYYVEGYLDKDIIRKHYEFDRTYESYLKIRQKEKADLMNLIGSDRSLSYLYEIDNSFVRNVVEYYENRVEEAERSDKENSNSINNKYKRFLFKNYQKIKKLNSKALEIRNNDYLNCVEVYEKSDDIKKIKEAIAKLTELKDYKDSERYISLCNRKITEVSLRNKENAFNEELNTTLKLANEYLAEGNFDQADDYFNKALDLDSNNNEAYLGILMAYSETKNREELFDYFKNLYHEDEYVEVEAVEEDTKHIEEMVEKCTLPGQLEASQIRRMYDYKRTFLSLVPARIKEKEEIIKEFDENPSIEFLKRNGDQTIIKDIDEVIEIYDNRIKEEEKKDKSRKTKISNAYQRFLFKTYTEVKNLYDKYTNEKEYEYRELIKKYKSSSDEEELGEIIRKLIDIDDYKEAKKYIKLAKEKLEKVKEDNAIKAHNEQIEVELRSAAAYLKSQDFDSADKIYNDIFELDPDNTEAYLGILMVESKTSDKDELTEYYKDLYADDEDIEIIDSVEEDTEHIDEIVNRYTIPNYLDSDTIRGFYVFDRSFNSLNKARNKQLERIRDELSFNPVINKLKEKNDKDLNRWIYEIEKAYEDRAKETKAEEEEKLQKAKDAYKQFLDDTDRKVKTLYYEFSDQKDSDIESDYLALIESFTKGKRPEDFEALIELFKSFGDYRDAAKYVDLCEEKIVNIKEEDRKDKIESLLKTSRILLDGRVYSLAKKNYTEIIDLGGENREVDLGMLLCDYECSDLDELKDHYISLYSDDIPENLEAVEVDKQHIDEIINKYTVKGYLDANEIEEYYTFDRNYESLVSSWKKQLDRIIEEMESNDFFMKLYDKNDSEIVSIANDIQDIFDKKIRETERDEKKEINRIKREYASFLSDTDKKIIELNIIAAKKQALDLKEEEDDKRRKAEKEEERKAEREKERTKRIEALFSKARKEETEEEKNEKESKQAEEIRLEEERIQKERQALEEREERIKEKEEEHKKKEQEEKELEEKKHKFEEEKQKLKEDKQKEKEEREKQKQKEEKQKEREAAKQAKAEERKQKTAERKPLSNENKLIIGLCGFALVLLGLLGTYIYQNVIVPKNKYENAIAMLNNGFYDEAIEVFTELGEYGDAEEMIKESKYQKGMELYNSGKYYDAAYVLNNLNYKDSLNRLSDAKKQIIIDAKIGSYVLFGQYEQDGIIENGREIIEWIVLDENDEGILLLSRYGLDSQKYHTDSNEVYWDSSSIRQWLNYRFAGNVFDNENPSDILTVSLDNYRYVANTNDTDYTLALAEITEDKVFLLSTEEIEQYFPTASSRLCEPVQKLRDNGSVAEDVKYCDWWLRSPGSIKENVSSIVKGSDGTISSSMYEISNIIRPAVWIRR